MKNMWFTADTHFGHENIIKFCNRPFSSVQEMDEVMVERWNSLVLPKDVIYHLGDFTLGTIDMFRFYDNKLNGKKFIVPGGHDWRWIRNYSAPRDGIKHILDPVYSLEIPMGDKYPLVIVLCHYAMRVWDRSHYGSLHLFGHSHGNLEGTEKSMDVGVDTNNFYPYHLDEILCAKC